MRAKKKRQVSLYITSYNDELMSSIDTNDEINAYLNIDIIFTRSTQN